MWCQNSVIMSLENQGVFTALEKGSFRYKYPAVPPNAKNPHSVYNNQNNLSLLQIDSYKNGCDKFQSEIMNQKKKPYFKPLKIPSILFKRGNFS